MSTAVPSSGSTDGAVAIASEQTVRALWWLAVTAAVAGIVLGVVMLAWPKATLAVVALIFGGWLLAQGIVRIFQAFTGDSLDVVGRVLRGTLGVLFILVGLVCLRNLFTALAVVATLIGAAWLVAGIIELVGALIGPGGTGGRLWRVLFGAISIVGGVVVLVWPAMSLATLVYITAIWTVAIGIFQLVVLFLTRHARTV